MTDLLPDPPDPSPPTIDDPVMLPIPPGMPAGMPSEVEPDAAIRLRPWEDPLIDTLGFDPRSSYVERFWLPILGPSTTWLLRRIAVGFDRSPGGFTMPLTDTARELGLGHKGGRHSPFMRSVWRSCQFDLARAAGEELEVRRRIPPLNRRQVVRLPESLQDDHRSWQEARIGPAAAASTLGRARTLAMLLLEIDTDSAGVEQRLTGLGLHPGVAREAAGWALSRHSEAAAAAAARVSA